MRRLKAIAALLVMAASGGAVAQTQFTPARGPGCSDQSKDGFGMWTCTGPSGYAVRFADEGNIVSLTIAPRRLLGGRREPTAQWRGAGKAFGDKVQWIMRAGVPRAAVIRTWRRPDGDHDGEIQELSVFSIKGDKACRFAAVDIHADKANEAALVRAEQAADSSCP